MRHAPSHLTRATRALTALVTVWCLGCSAFEPMFAALTGSLTVTSMVCASDGRPSDSTDIVTTLDVRTDALAVSAIFSGDEPPGPGYDCDCAGSCHAPSPPALAATPDRHPPPSVPSAEPTTLLSIEREPLVPPPQRAL
ncbi:MAG: hypothetical protein WKG32_07495 [Gemmatimonadaceae bacterium]